MKKMIILLLILGMDLFSRQARISQVDTGELLLEQKVRLYISVTDRNGEPVRGLQEEQFRLFEAVPGRSWQKVDKLYFREGADASEGLRFILLIDNSGSMYRRIDGRKALNLRRMKISAVKKAVSDFLDNTRLVDSTGIIAFNSFYREICPLSHDRQELKDSLNYIHSPEGDERATELYYSLHRALDSFQGGGRKVVIVLSDGEDYPYRKYTLKPHPEKGEASFLPADVLAMGQERSVSVFAVLYSSRGSSMDQGLKKIALGTGGAVFTADDRRELGNIYQQINRQVLGEYQLVYRASMLSAERKYIKTVIKSHLPLVSSSRYYLSDTVMGPAMEDYSPLFFLLLLPLLVLLMLLALLEPDKSSLGPCLEELDDRGGLKGTLIDLDDGVVKFRKGSGSSAETVIIAYDDDDQTYRLKGNKKIQINNCCKKEGRLHSGDVIKIGAKTMVFKE